LKNQFPQSASRALHEKVKTAKKRKNSSVRWLERQINDPYVIAAKKQGYKSRAAYKLIELNEKFKFLKPGLKVLELGSAPGAWTQVNVNILGKNNVWCIDKNQMELIEGSFFEKINVLDEMVFEKLDKFIKQKVDIIESDMAASSTGHSRTDHLRTMSLCEASYDISINFLKNGGTFISKVLQGGTENDLLIKLKESFVNVKHAKPKSSRKESSEMYVIATNFRGKI
tara:strand:+ start:421 stop:1101 length:681 start_codon:yes stop_codon:yes gene_type:complete